MKAFSPSPLHDRSRPPTPSEAERSLLYAELIGFNSKAAPVRGGAAREAHAQRRRNNPGNNA